MSRRLLIASVAVVASSISLTLAAGVFAGSQPSEAKPVVPSSGADLSADPNGQATRAVTQATLALNACLLKNGAVRVENAGEPGFGITGITDAVLQACAAEDTRWRDANADPQYKKELDALTLVMNRAWACVAAKGFTVAGFSPGASDAHVPAQAGMAAAFGACKSEAASSLGVTIP